MQKVSHISLCMTQWKIQIVKKSQSLVPNLGFYVPTNTLSPWKEKKNKMRSCLSAMLMTCQKYIEFERG